METLDQIAGVVGFVGLTIFLFVYLFWSLSDMMAQKRHEREIERSKIDG